jgi:hypothetical protein
MLLTLNKNNWRLSAFTIFMVFTTFLINSSCFAQGKPASNLGVSLARSIIIDVKSGMDITFVEQDGVLNSISVLDVDDSSELGEADPAGHRQAGLIRVTGAQVETMIDVEVKNLRGLDHKDNQIFSIYDFNLVDEGAGAIVTIMPSSDDESYVLPIGGTIDGRPDDGEVYIGVNVVNVNYL